MKTTRYQEKKSQAAGNAWVRTHVSALFIGALFVSSILLLFIGMFLEGVPGIGRSVGIVFIQLSGSALAGGIFTVFMSFDDVREYMSQVVARLFVGAEIVNVLSSATKRELQQKLILDRNRRVLSSLEPSLVSHLQSIQDRCLGAIHVHNFNTSSSMTPHPENPKFIINHSVTSFLVKAHHLPNGEGTFPYRFAQEITMPSDTALDADSFLLDFLVEVEDKKFSREEAKVEKGTSGNVPVMRCYFEHDVHVVGELEMRITSRVVTSISDPTEVIYSRYPTYGFRASLSFREGLTYDCAWFRNWDPRDYFPGRGQVDSLSNGISAFTHGWTLPGEGVVLYWFKSDK